MSMPGAVGEKGGRGSPGHGSPDPASQTSEDHGTRRANGLRIALTVVRAGPLLILTGLVIAASLATPLFLEKNNIGNVLAQSAVISVLAIGQLLVILTRGVDLSVGSVVALASVLGALAFEDGGGGAVVIGAMVGTGLAVGLINGAVFVYGRVPHPFIVTLATLSIARGLALIFSDGRPHPGMPQSVQTIGGDSIDWLPYSFFAVAGLALLAWVLTKKLVWGRWIYAVGGNPEAARRTSIPVGKVLLSVYALSGLAAGIGALLTAGRTNSGSPAFGELAELDAIAAVVIGGAAFAGGRGHVGNALVGALMIGVIRNALNLLGVDAFYQLVAIGVVILIAVEADVLRGHLEERFRVQQGGKLT
jgi:ribose transport system permease protein